MTAAELEQAADEARRLALAAVDVARGYRARHDLTGARLALNLAEAAAELVDELDRLALDAYADEQEPPALVLEKGTR